MVFRKSLKVTLVGDSMVGKTHMLITYTTKVFPNGYVPNVFEMYSANICVDGQEFFVSLEDTIGREGYESLNRPLAYPRTDCFLLLFAISARSSYENVASKWYPEIKQHGPPNVPIVLLGTKGDLRSKKDLDIVTQAECKEMKKKIKAFRYVECSAAQQEGLEEVFIEAIRAVLKKPTTKRFCDIL